MNRKAREPIKIAVESNYDNKELLKTKLDIPEQIPKSYKEKVEKILNNIQKDNSITWDETGHVTIKEQNIDGNIVDLLTDLVRERKHYNPAGWKEFLIAMRVYDNYWE